MNQLTGFYSNCLYVYLIKQQSLLQKEGKNWDFLVVSFLMSWILIALYCVLHHWLSGHGTDQLIPCLLCRAGCFAWHWLLIFVISEPWIPIWANMLGLCTLPSMFCDTQVCTLQKWKTRKFWKNPPSQGRICPFCSSQGLPEFSASKRTKVYKYTKRYKKV